MAKLVVIHPSLAGLSHELGEGWVAVGRGYGNAFQIVEPSISGRHCEVCLHGQELFVRDLNSTNGTFVRDEKIADAILKSNATFRVGNVEIRFEASVPAAAAPAKVAPTSTTVRVPLPAAKPPAAPAPAPVAARAATAPTTAIAHPKPAKPVPPGPHKFQVLFVDDSLEFLETFGALCGELGGSAWEIHAATTADCALQILEQQTIDLAVLDINMPTIDGIQLLGIVNRRYPQVRVVVMTGLASEDNRTASLAKGAELFLEKPVSPESIQVAFNILNDLLKWAQRDGFTGALRQVGLTDVIQMECLGRQSLILEVRNRQSSGQIFIESGNIIHATAGDLTGEKAFQQLLSLNGGQFQLHPFRPPPERTVQGSWEFLVMAAAQIHDEARASSDRPEPASKGDSQFLAAGENVVSVNAAAGEPPLSAVPGAGQQP